MPKKGSKGKQSQTPEVKPSLDTSLPQVWLPNQPLPDDDIESGPASNLPSPSQDEQQRMAEFWEAEESRGPRTWENDQELDYSEIARKMVGTEHDLDSSKNSSTPGNPDLFSYAQSSQFIVKYLGHMQDCAQNSSSDNQIKTLAAIDTAQKQGILPWVTSEESQRRLTLSKYGIKVTDVKKTRVYQRHPLHWIANVTYYEDTYGKHMIVLRQNKPDRAEGDPQELHIFECAQESEAKNICLTLAQAFEAVFNKMKLVQNLHSTERQ